MIRTLARLLEKSRRHWLFWPFFSLVVIIAAYVFFLSSSGYLAYTNKHTEKEIIEGQIDRLRKTKQDLEQKVRLLRDDEAALQNFIEKLRLFEDDVHLLRFLESNKAKEGSRTFYDIKKWQRLFVIAASLLLLGVFALAWRLKGRFDADAADV